MDKKQLNPATIAIVIVVVVSLIGLIGFQFMNRAPADPIAEAVMKERGGANAQNPTNSPMGGAAAPKSGSSDYAAPPNAAPGAH